MAPSSSPSQLSFANVLQGSIDELRDLVACRICIRLMYEPYTTQCGHTFCYSCLCQWFNRDPTLHTRKTCPDCRAQVLSQPAPAYLIRQITQTFINTAVLLPSGETTETHKQLQREEAALVEQDRTNRDRDGGLFKGRFRPTSPHLAPIRDGPDGVERCPMCTWELEDGMCNHCGYTVLGDDEEDLYGMPIGRGLYDFSASDDGGDGSIASDALSFSEAELEEILAEDYDSTGSINDRPERTHRNFMGNVRRYARLPRPPPRRRYRPRSIPVSLSGGSSEDESTGEGVGSPGSLRNFMVDDMAVDDLTVTDPVSDDSDESSQYHSDLHRSGSEASEHTEPPHDPHSQASSDTTAVNTSSRRSRGRRVAVSSSDLDVDHSDSEQSSTRSSRHGRSRRSRFQRTSVTSVDTDIGGQSGAGFSPLQHDTEDSVSQNIPIQVDSDSDAPPVRRRARRQPVVAASISSEGDEDDVRGPQRTRKRPTAASFMSSDEDNDDVRGVNISRPSPDTASDHVRAPTMVESSPARASSSRQASSPNISRPPRRSRDSRRSSTRQAQTSTDDEDVAVRRLHIPERSVHPRVLPRSTGPSSPSPRQTVDQRRERKRLKRQDRLRRQQEQRNYDRHDTLRHAHRLAYIGA